MVEDSVEDRGRVLSIDVFRGATIVAMVFANSTTKMGLPWWMEHASHTQGKAGLITWVDVIFPAFMFIMGLAVPLAVERRLGRRVSAPALIGHVALRGVLLMWLGGVMYGFGMDTEAMGVPTAVWAPLGFVALVLLLGDLPRGPRAAKPTWIWILRAAALAYFAWATTVFRGADGSLFFRADSFAYSVLGHLGFAYICATFLYLVTRKSPLARLGICSLIILLGVHAQHEGAFLLARWPQPFAWLGLPSHLVDHALVVLAGTFLGDLFVTRTAPWFGDPRRFMVLFGLGFLAAAALADGDSFATFLGLRKTLFCIGACTLGFLLVWETARRRGATVAFRTLTRPLVEVGRNPLFAYCLQFGLGGVLALMVGDETLVMALRGYTVFGAHGWLGAAYTALPLTVTVVAVTSLANRNRLFVRL